MKKIHQFKANSCEHNINIFVLAENDKQAFEKIYNELGYIDIELRRINRFIPLTFSAIITQLDLDLIETERSKKRELTSIKGEY